MLEFGQLLQQARNHPARLLRFGMGIVESPEVGQSVGQRKGGFYSRQCRVDRNRASGLIRGHHTTGTESPVEAVRLPAKAPEFGIGLGVLIAEVRVCSLDFLRDDV